MAMVDAMIQELRPSVSQIVLHTPIVPRVCESVLLVTDGP